MKKIAVDLDGVVFDTENLFRVYSEIYDVDVIGKDSVIDNTQRTFQKRYNWSDEEKQKFYNLYAQYIIDNGKIMPGADIVLKKLYKDFEIVAVTARNNNEIDVFKKFLENYELKNVKIFSNEHDKIDRYISENVNYIIDDDRYICMNAANNKIKALHFKSPAEDRIEENDYLKVVCNWGEIYKYLMFSEGKDE